MGTVKIDMAQLRSAKSVMEALASAIDVQRQRAASATPISLPSLGDPLARKAQYLRDRVPEVQAVIDLGTLLAGAGATSATYEASSTSVAEVQQRLGTALADAARDLSETSRPEDWERFGQVLARQQRNGPVMAAMYTELGPRDTVRLLNQLSLSRSIFGASDEADETYRSAAESIRNGLTTASQQVGFDGETFGRELARNCLAPMLTDEEQQDRPATLNGASILAFLLDRVDYDTDFLRGTVDTLDEFERDYEHLGGGATYSYHHNGNDGLNNWLSQTHGSTTADPMAYAMRALSRNTELGLEFFTSEPDRQAYYFRDRHWESDGYEGVSMMAARVTTDVRLLERDPQAVTGLASAFVHHMAANDEFDHVDTAASRYVGQLLGFYTPSVADAMDASTSDGVPLPYQVALNGFGRQWAPLFARAELADLAANAMATEEGLRAIAQGVGNLQGTWVNNLVARLQQNEDPNLEVILHTRLRNVLQASAQIQGFYQKIAGQTQIDDAVAADAQVAAFTTLVSDAIGLAPVPGAKWAGDELGNLATEVVGYGWNKAVELGTRQVEAAWGAETGPRVGVAEANAEVALAMTKWSTYQLLLDAGAVEPGGAGMPSSWAEMEALRTSDDQQDQTDYHTYLSQATNLLAGYATEADLDIPYAQQFERYYDNPAGS